MYLLKCNENVNNYVNPANDSLILDTIFFIQLYSIIIGYLRYNIRHEEKNNKKITQAGGVGSQHFLLALSIFL